MNRTREGSKHRRLKVELVVLACLLIYIVRTECIDTATLKAEVLRQVVKIDRDNLEAYRFLAKHYNLMEQTKKATEVREGIARLDPTNAKARVNLGKAYFACGQVQNELDAFHFAVALKPDNAPAHLYLAKAHLQRGDKDFALQEYAVLKTLDEDLANQLLSLINKED